MTFVAGIGNLADCDQQVPDVSAVEEHDVAVDCQLVLCTVDCEMSTSVATSSDEMSKVPVYVYVCHCRLNLCAAVFLMLRGSLAACMLFTCSAFAEELSLVLHLHTKCCRSACRRPHAAGPHTARLILFLYPQSLFQRHE